MLARLRATLWRPLATILAAWWCALPACHAQFISRYDEATDRAATQLHQQFESFLLEMEWLSQSDAPEAARQRTHEANREFYRQAQVALQSMRLRARAIPMNQRTLEQVDLLRDSVARLEDLHREGGERGLRPAVIAPLRELLESQFLSIIALELAKKRGDAEN